MKRLLFIIAIIPLQFIVSAGTVPDTLLSNLMKIQNYKGGLHFTVTLPMTDEEVEYEVEMASRKSPSDTLCGYDYFFRFAGKKDTVEIPGFILYYAGNLYRFEYDKFREYHFDEHPEPFMGRRSGGRVFPGVQKQGMFFELLPMEIGKQLKGFLQNDRASVKWYPDTIVSGISCNAVKVTETLNGETLRNMLFAFDKNSGLPVYREVENNPGHLGSQTVTVRYTSYDTAPLFDTGFFDESMLLQQYGDIMGRYRESSYRAESLRGKRAPVFSLPVYDDTRWFSLREELERPVILLFLDTSGEASKTEWAELQPVIERFRPELQSAVLFCETDPGSFGDAVSQQPGGENILCGASSVAGRYGVTGYPSFFIVTPGGTVSEVVIGYSPGIGNTLSGVLEKLKIKENK